MLNGGGGGGIFRLFSPLPRKSLGTRLDSSTAVSIRKVDSEVSIHVLHKEADIRHKRSIYDELSESEGWGCNCKNVFAVQCARSSLLHVASL